MRRSRMTNAAIAVVALGIIGLAAGFAQASTAGPVPTQPPWVTQEGAVDLRKVPDQIPVLDQTGRVCGYASKSEIFRPPSATEREAIMKRQETLDHRLVSDSDGREALAFVDPPAGHKCG